MIRILDVRRMLMSLRLNYLTGVCFTVTDPLIEENNRCLVLTGTEFSGIMLMDAKPENSEGILPIRALTDLIFGVKTPGRTAEDARCGDDRPDGRRTEKDHSVVRNVSE